MELSAQADVHYDPSDPLPSELKGTGINLTTDIYVRPRLTVDLTCQFGIFFGEAFSPPRSRST